MAVDEKERLLFVSAHWEKGGAETVFRTTLDICSAAYLTGYFVPDNSSFSLLRLARKLYTFKPDVIHIHNYHSAWVFIVLFFYRLSNDCQVVYTAHDHRFLCAESYYGRYEKGVFIPYKSPPTDWKRIKHIHSNKSTFIDITKKLKWFFWFRIMRIHRVPDIIFTPSNYLKNQFEDDKAFQNMRIRLLRNPTQFSEESESPNTPEKSERQLIKLVYLGRLSFEKGLEEFIDLLSQIESTSYTFTIYGSGKLKNRLEEKISSLDLQESILLGGQLAPAEIHKTLRQYDVLVLPSIWNENAPLVLVEGALSGLRLLASHYGGTKETAELCGNEYLFDPRDSLSFQKAFEACKSDMYNQLEMKKHHLEELRKVYSYDRYLDTFTTELNEIKVSR